MAVRDVATINPLPFSTGVPDLEALRVQGKIEERCNQLCGQAATEHDPERLMELVEEIIQLLDEKEKQLKQPGSSRVSS
jgi:hypothetical protein